MIFYQYLITIMQSIMLPAISLFDPPLISCVNIDHLPQKIHEGLNCDTVGFSDGTYRPLQLNLREIYIPNTMSDFDSWESLEYPIHTSSPIALASWGPDRLDIFARSDASSVIHKWWDGKSWSAWQSLGGKILREPVAVSCRKNRIDVFALGTDSACWHIWFDGNNWSQWQSLGGTFITSFTAISRDNDHIDIFSVGTERDAWNKAWNGRTWTNWKQMGFSSCIVSEVTAVALSRNEMLVACTGESHMYEMHCSRWKNGQWVREDLPNGAGVCLHTKPAAVSWGPNRVDIFVLGKGEKVCHISWERGYSQHEGWSNWESFDGTASSPVTACSKSEKKLDIFVAGTGAGCLHKAWNGSSWGEWEFVGYSGGGPAHPINCISITQNRIDIVGVDMSQVGAWHSSQG